MISDVCKEVVSDISRLPVQPEGEKSSDTPTTVGEANHLTLAKDPDDGMRLLTDTTSLEPFEIVRATMPFRIEPWRLAEDQEAHRKRTCAGKAGCKACALIDALYATQRACAQMANLGARYLERADGEAWEKARGEGRKLTAKDWPSRELNLYQYMRNVDQGVLSGIVAAVAKKVADKWQTDRFDVLVRADKAAARYRAETFPILLRHADVKLIETEIRDVFELRCSFASGRTETRGKQWSIPIRAKDQKQYQALHAIATGTWKIGQLQIQRDRQGKHWELRVAYKRQIERTPQTERVAAVNRGITCILAVTTDNGDQLIYDGSDIEAYLLQMQARRKRYQRGYPLSGRKGRGRGHALRAIESLNGKAERWRKTRLQTIAREVANWLVKRGVTKVLLDDLKGIRDGAVELLDGGKPVWDRIQQWPYFEMGSRLQACLQEAGVVCEPRPAHFISRDCPSCGYRDEERAVKRQFKCPNCNYSRHVDVVAGMNLLTRERLAALGGTAPATQRPSRKQVSKHPKGKDFRPKG